MVKRESPTINQANIMFFITAVVTLAGSAFFQPKVGIGTNLWINEFVYILFPPLLMARINGWPAEVAYRFKKISVKNKFISVLTAFSMWPLSFTFSKTIRMLLDNKIGVIKSSNLTNISIYQSLLLVIGMVILAPICEEIFFRGFVQGAYEGCSKRYGFVIAALIFGFYHVLNGISEVIPACILGLGMGFLVYKTGSLASSMLFHASANACALLFGGTFEIYIREVTPAWLYIIAFAGFCFSIVLLRSVKEESHSLDSEEEVDNDNKLHVTGMLFLILSALFLIAVGVFEIINRLGIIQ